MAKTLLTYAIHPSQVPANNTRTFEIIATNPNQHPAQNPVTLMSLSITLPIGPNAPDLSPTPRTCLLFPPIPNLPNEHALKNCVDWKSHLFVRPHLELSSGGPSRQPSPEDYLFRRGYYFPRWGRRTFSSRRGVRIPPRQPLPYQSLPTFHRR